MMSLPLHSIVSACASPDLSSSSNRSDKYTTTNSIGSVVSSHCRYHSDTCSHGDIQSSNASDNNSIRTEDENNRLKSRLSRTQSSSSFTSQYEIYSDDERKKKGNQPLPSLSSGSAALLQLRINQRRKISSRSSKNSVQVLTKKTLMQNVLVSPSKGTTETTSPTILTSLHHWEEEHNALLPDKDIAEGMTTDIVEESEGEHLSATLSPSDQQEKRIMFHGREIFTEDLIGLRVAKNFAGYGRCLGQVVKFDKRMALFTVVYSDGDAEDLTVDGTLQILIQDEIERPDPSQPPPAISLLLKKGEDELSPASPDTKDPMTPPVPPQRQSSTLQHHARRIQVSEREAQFVISLFENHALPILLRQGWRVQVSNHGRYETRFISANGEIFESALDVVAYIAVNRELLTSCFPANVHSAILSLLPREVAVSSAYFTDRGHESMGSTTSRKRTVSDSSSAARFDSKRIRHVCDETYGVVVPIHADLERGSDIMHCRQDNMIPRTKAPSRMSTYCRQGMSGRVCMLGDRFYEGETTNEGRAQSSSELRGYQRASDCDSVQEAPFSLKWSGAESEPGRAKTSKPSCHFLNTPRWSERGDELASDHDLEGQRCNRIRTKSSYIHQSDLQAPADAANGTATGLRKGFYQEMTGSPHGSRADARTNGFTYSPYSTVRVKASNCNRTSATSPVSHTTASFMSPGDTLGANAAFSMADFDRISSARPGSAHAD